MRGVWNTTEAVSGAGSMPGSTARHPGISGRYPSPVCTRGHPLGDIPHTTRGGGGDLPSRSLWPAM